MQKKRGKVREGKKGVRRVEGKQWGKAGERGLEGMSQISQSGGREEGLNEIMWRRGGGEISGK